ncbi:hypothetical protein [Paraburkholderia sp. EG304]|uniref:hypothetical protein n=1 Tax=Paraburkholderia sp. EG304 TaxID=3237015 RepID=UPI00397DD458
MTTDDDTRDAEAGDVTQHLGLHRMRSLLITLLKEMLPRSMFNGLRDQLSALKISSKFRPA